MNTSPMLPHERGLANTLKAERDDRHYRGWHDENGKSQHPLFPDIPPGMTWEQYQAQREQEQRPQHDEEQAWREKSRAWHTSAQEHYRQRIEQLYPIPRHWENTRARARHYHLDLADMDPMQLRAELNALHQRVWEARCTNPIAGTSVTFSDPAADWLREREARILAALRGELPPGTCPQCSGAHQPAGRGTGKPVARQIIFVDEPLR